MDILKILFEIIFSMAEMFGKHIPELLEIEVASQLRKQKYDWVIIASLEKQVGSVIVLYSESIIIKTQFVQVTVPWYCSALLHNCSYY